MCPIFHSKGFTIGKRGPRSCSSFKSATRAKVRCLASQTHSASVLPEGLVYRVEVIAKSVLARRYKAWPRKLRSPNAYDSQKPRFATARDGEGLTVVIRRG